MHIVIKQPKSLLNPIAVANLTAVSGTPHGMKMGSKI